MKNKIGVGVITCNRQNFFEKCINSIPSVDTLVVVNDGSSYPRRIYPSSIKEVIQHGTNKCVGISKNEALRYLIQDECEYIFLIEDDMLIKNKNVFEEYIRAANKSGIHHLNFAYHGPANFKPNRYGAPNPREIIDYGDDVKISLNPNAVGSFSYYHKGVIKHVGYIDEKFNNSWDHVEHTHRIIKEGLHPPFWWFADLANSMDYIEEQASSITVAEKITTGEVGNSTIQKDEKWQQSFQMGALWYKKKHGAFPTQTPDTPKEQVLGILREIKKNYAR